jgi:adenosyl cobinamide kinase/adenosyl cobinamide phosphate guanylyltransferase
VDPRVPRKVSGKEASSEQRSDRGSGGHETKEDLGRVVNAMTTAKEFKEAGDEIALVFDGAGTKWIPELSDGHKYSDLFGEVRDKVAGACEYCSKAYGVLEGVEQAGVKLLGEYEHHPSLRGYASQGYQVITF